MKLKQLCERLSILDTNADFNSEISGICYDSRKAKDNYLFVAISGLTVDGNQFIDSAIDNGAVVVVCEKKPREGIKYVLVSNCREALALISGAFYGYPADQMKIIGITGTSGKTTSTNLIKHILETVTEEKVGLIGTNGNMIGDLSIHSEFTTPESLELHELFSRMLSEGCKYVIMEVSSHSLFMSRVDGIRFEVAGYTNLSQDHLDIHGSMEEYARVKSRLFTLCNKAVINVDDEHSPIMLDAAVSSVLTTAIDSVADMRAENLKLSTKSVGFTLNYAENKIDATLAIPGKFSVYNALTAISVCVSLGMPVEKCVQALGTAHGVKGRVESIPTDGDYSIIIDYSHKPDALEKVLKMLRQVTRGRLICLFGCGGDRDRDKRPKMARIAAENADYVVVTSDNPRTENPQEIIDEILTGLLDTKTPYIAVCDRIEAIHTTIDMVEDGDVILLAGKGHEDYQVIGHHKIHMDEREIVSEYIKDRNK